MKLYLEPSRALDREGEAPSLRNPFCWNSFRCYPDTVFSVAWRRNLPQPVFG